MRSDCIDARLHLHGGFTRDSGIHDVWSRQQWPLANTQSCDERIAGCAEIFPRENGSRQNKTLEYLSSGAEDSSRSCVCQATETTSHVEGCNSTLRPHQLAIGAIANSAISF